MDPISVLVKSPIGKDWHILTSVSFYIDVFFQVSLRYKYWNSHLPPSVLGSLHLPEILDLFRSLLTKEKISKNFPCVVTVMELKSGHTLRNLKVECLHIFKHNNIRRFKHHQQSCRYFSIMYTQCIKKGLNNRNRNNKYHKNGTSLHKLYQLK